VIAACFAYVLAGPILLLFLYVTVYLPARFLFSAVGDLVDCLLWEPAALLDAGEYVLTQVAGHRGGKLEQPDRRRIVYHVPDSSVFLELRRSLNTALVLHVIHSGGSRAISRGCLDNSPVRWLHRAGFRVRFRQNELRIRKHLRAGEMLFRNVEGVLDACCDLHAFLEHYVDVGLRKVRSTAARCAYCKERLADEPSVRCELCGAPHHSECFGLHSGCSVFGCSGRLCALCG